jgi:hypothetical protein
MLALVLSPAVLGTAQAARAQAPPAGGDTRAARLAAQKAEKATQVTVYEPNKAEIWATC